MLHFYHLTRRWEMAVLELRGDTDGYVETLFI